MDNNDSKSNIGNHPEVEKLDDICNIAPDSEEAKKVCKPTNQYKKKKPDETK